MIGRTRPWSALFVGLVMGSLGSGEASAQGVEDVVILGQDGLLDAAEYLAENNVPVIISGVHRLPQHDHDDIDAPFRLPAELVAAGVKTGMTYPGENMNGRNLPFIAGTASAYGLAREDALTMITLTNAEILGIEDYAFGEGFVCPEMPR